MKKLAILLLALVSSCAEPQSSQMSATLVIRNTDRVRVSCVYSTATVSFHESDAANQYEQDPFTLLWDENQESVRIEISPDTPSPCVVIFSLTGFKEPEPVR